MLDGRTAFSSTARAALRRVALSVGNRLVRFGRNLADPGPADPAGAGAYTERVQKEIERFKSVEHVHDLPEIFHFWSHRYVRPKLEEVFQVSTFEDFYAKYILQYSADHPGETVDIVSVGAGNADTEVRIAQVLRQRGLDRFQFHCLDINPSMLNRGRQLAEQSRLATWFRFHEIDIARWRAERSIPVVMAHHSLHHIVALEELFRNIHEAIGPTGYFLICDMVGRNGHMRWPEALTIIRNIWKTMPDRYKHNHQLSRFEEVYENWDCSKEGFEGIRSQDILPLLVKLFYFDGFVGYGNLPDIFIDRGFGHNFDAANPEDTAFVDHLGALNDQLIDEGVIKPTQIAAVMRGVRSPHTRCHRHWTPGFCIRPLTLPAI